MTQPPALSLDGDHAKTLIGWQGQVDCNKIFAECVGDATKLYENLRKRKHPALAHVESVLEKMCTGIGLCAYCELSEADQIEHIYPKALYPERTFVWRNYLYVCGKCNRSKGMKWAFIKNNHLTPVRGKRSSFAAIHEGKPAFIDPRQENPLDLLAVDLEDTFRFVPRWGRTPEERKRADYTWEVLELNSEKRTRERRNAYKEYKRKLRSYPAEKAGGEERICDLRSEVREMRHRFVWLEMKRSHEEKTLAHDPELVECFGRAPEMLGW